MRGGAKAAGGYTSDYDLVSDAVVTDKEKDRTRDRGTGRTK